MLQSQTLFPSARAEALLGTMAKHFGHKIPVTTEGTQMRLQFPMGQVLAEARADGIRLQVEAEDAAGLSRVQEVLVSHLLRFAHREDPQPPVWQSA